MGRSRLKDFVTQVESAIQKVPAQPVVTGIAPNIYHKARAIRTSFIRATIYALGLIVVLVLLDLRDIAQTLLAISVLGLGLPVLVGLMGSLGLDWNFANFFGLPILIGAGHEWRLHDPPLSRATARPAPRLENMGRSRPRHPAMRYVTCSSFAFFGAVGHHRGLRSLGIVMAIGTACIYLSSIMVLHPLLKWILERAPARLGTGWLNPTQINLR